MSDINGTTNKKKNPYDFIKYYPLNGMCPNLSSIRLLVYKLVIQVKLLLQNFKTIEKSGFCVLIKHCFLMGGGGNTVQAKQSFDKCYSDFTPSETMVKRWYADFKRSRTSTNDAEHSSHPNSALVLEKKLHKLILAIRKLKLREIAEGLKISEGSVFAILHEHLSMRKLCSKWVLRLLTVDQKQQCVGNSERCLQLFQHNKNEFLCKYVTMNEKDPPLHSGIKSVLS